MVPLLLVHSQFAKQKASELEDYQNISLSGTDMEGDEEPAVKRRKLAKQVQEYIVYLQVPFLCMRWNKKPGQQLSATIRSI